MSFGLILNLIHKKIKAVTFSRSFLLYIYTVFHKHIHNSKILVFWLVKKTNIDIDTLTGTKIPVFMSRFPMILGFISPYIQCFHP